MRRVEFLLPLLTVNCAVRAVPLQRDIYDPLLPLKSVASEIFGYTTAISGPESSIERTQTALSASSTPSADSPATSTQSSNTQTDLTGTGSVTVTLSNTQLSTGSPSPTNAASNSAVGTATTTPTGILSSSPGSTVAPISVVPTTTESSGSSPTDAGSDPGSNSGSGGNSGSGSTSADSTSGSGLSPGEIAAAVILPVIASAALLFLVFRFCKPLREKFQAWRQERLDRSAYRRALDDPVLAFGMRQQSDRGSNGFRVSDEDQSARPLSFGFRNPQRQYPSIKRKPLTWDAARIGGQGASSIGMAIPMPLGHRPRSLSEISEVSDISSDGEARYEDARSNQVSPEGILS
ncbi:hypothetical protein AYO20_02330 [Fonsecaea nubica]|uniref:Uncharacterized protein n=1 Tax=Fonsecaea nubica TaxID=856822 RepID=A0A178DAJ5_9EURO|nr:hypothetical protein AYO20_02330 [Fonsecaea nubica]OAL38271.1 hypothetical protein AYO20_02330 [Fonsecaea nubica]